MKTSITIEARSTDIDSIGHVNNAKYLEYMEWGREDWYNQIGLPFDAFNKMNVATVTVNIDINYKKEVSLGERLTVSTEPLKKGKSSFVLKHEIHNEKKTLVAEALVTSVIMDLATRKATPLPEALENKIPHDSYEVK